MAPKGLSMLRVDEPELTDKTKLKEWNKWAYTEALQNVQKIHPRRFEGAGDDEMAYKFPVCGTSEQQMAARLGTGMGLYFDFLKFLAGICLLGFVTSGFSFIASVTAFQASKDCDNRAPGALPDEPCEDGYSDDITTQFPAVLALTTAGSRILCKTDFCRFANFFGACLQILFITVTFFLIRKFKARCSTIARENTAKSVTILDYTVECFGFPKTVERTAVAEHMQNALKADMEKQKARFQKGGCFALPKATRALLSASIDDFISKDKMKVVDVRFSSNNAALLRAGFKKAPMERQVAALEAKIERAEVVGKKHLVKKYTKRKVKKEAKLEKYRKRIANKEKKVDNLSAFVTFNHQDGKDAALLTFRKRGFFAKCCGAFKHLKFNKRHIRAKETSEPTALIWENLEYRGKSSTSARRCLTLTVTTLLLMVSFMLIVFVQSLKNQAAAIAVKTANCEGLGNPRWDSNFTSSVGPNKCSLTPLTPLSGSGSSYDGDSKYADSLLSCDPMDVTGITDHPWQQMDEMRQEDCERCFCTSLLLPTKDSIPQALADAGMDESDPSAVASVYGDLFGSKTPGLSKVLPACGEVLYPIYLGPIITVVAGAVAGVMNAVMKKVLPPLAQMERHASQTELLVSTASKLFYAQLLNTGIVLLIVTAGFPDLYAKYTCWDPEEAEKVFSGNGTGDDFSMYCAIGKAGLVFKGEGTDFDPKWFVNVAAAVMMTLIVQTGIVVGPTILAWILFKVKILFTKGGKITVDSMETLLTGPQFKLAKRVGETMNYIGIVFIFGFGSPLIYGLGFFHFTITYYTDKFACLDLYRDPPQYDEVLIAKNLKVFKWLLFCHALFSFWVYGLTPGVQISEYSGYTGYDIDDAQNSTGYDTSEYDRFNVIGKVTNTMASLLFFLICIVMLVLLILYLLYSVGPIRIIVLALSKTMSCGKKKKVAPAEVTEENYRNPPMEAVCGIRTEWDSYPNGPEGSPDEFDYPSTVAKHNGLRKVKGSNRFISIDDVMAHDDCCSKTFSCCAKLAPLELLFRLFCLAPTSKKVSREAWDNAEPQEVRIVGPGKEDYNIETNPFYSDAFLTKEKIQQQGMKTGQRTAKTPKSADNDAPPPEAGATSPSPGVETLKLE